MAVLWPALPSVNVFFTCLLVCLIFDSMIDIVLKEYSTNFRWTQNKQHLHPDLFAYFSVNNWQRSAKISVILNLSLSLHFCQFCFLFLETVLCIYVLDCCIFLMNSPYIIILIFFFCKYAFKIMSVNWKVFIFINK